VLRRLLVPAAALSVLSISLATGAPAGPATALSAARVTPNERAASTPALTTAAAPIRVAVVPGDTYGRWATRYCGGFSKWPAIQQANGWPERLIPVGASALIACASSTPVPASPPRVPARPPSGSGWVHPLASGKHGNSCYGWRASTGSFHGGVDMAQPYGTTIRAAAAGVIFRKAYQAGGAGYYVVISHGGGVFTLYMHMPSPSPLPVGAHVAAGQSIGRVGATGNATGPHLHFEVRLGGTANSARVNPAPFMAARGVNIGC